MLLGRILNNAICQISLFMAVCVCVFVLESNDLKIER